jgi:putative transcriptional regulator
LEKTLVRRNWLKELRKEKGYTVRTMAKEFGISWTYYSDIENGRKNPSLFLAIKVSKYFGINVERFTEGLIA